jgi:hypothetical protein
MYECKEPYHVVGLNEIMVTKCSSTLLLLTKERQDASTATSWGM